MEFDPILFREFIRKKFSEWRGDSRESLADFAGYLGVSQQVASNWYNGYLKNRPLAKMYEKLINLYGLEVYDVLALPRPSSIALSVLPREIRERVEAYLVDVANTFKNESIDPESNRAETVAREILARHGFVDISNK